MDHATDEHQRRLLHTGLDRSRLTLEELWTRYFALGGSLGLVEVEAFLQGLMPAPDMERDMLAHAVNERLDEMSWQQRVPYRHVPREPRPDGGPLAALVRLLEDTRLAAPERLPGVAAAAGHALDVDLEVYLVDYDQEVLVPLAARHEEPRREPLRVDTTLAGRAFQLGEMLVGSDGQVTRLWVPLLDGVERLGVLDVVPRHAADVHDPRLREQCSWFSDLLGHLVTGTNAYGDALDAARRLRPRTAAAELVWGLLPSLTAGTERFQVSAMLQPSHDLGGDAFDYALAERRVALAVFDAMGHALGAGLISATALSAYRCARREGADLHAQADAVDRAVTDQFGAEAFLTGVLAELDLDSGHLRYIGAGHPHPLLMREGRVVKELAGGRRTPFGMAHGAVTLGEEVLEPGDWLALYTDGVTEARDGTGAMFGEDRLIDFLRREAAAGQPPPETVRRLTRAVMAHQSYVLQDDATILLASWSRAGFTA